MQPEENQCSIYQSTMTEELVRFYYDVIALQPPLFQTDEFWGYCSLKKQHTLLIQSD